ncbi:MAG: germination protein YpeB [Clostridiaceae bacterium]|nr:germination protein YpeB [Clostridiaceae bacterium]
MNRQKKALLATFIVAAFAVAVGFAVQYASEAAVYKRILLYERTRAMANLSESMNDIASAMEKGRYATSPVLLASVSAEIWQEAESARVSLSELPLDCAPLDSTCKFIAQAGDYAFFIVKKASSGEALTDEERASLDELASIAKNYADSLSVMVAEADAGTLLYQSDATDSRTISGEFTSLEEDFPEYATLIYDGPLSDHIERQTPAMTTNAPEITPDDALARAHAFLGAPAGTLTMTGEQAGNMPAYCMSGELDGEHVYIEVTRQDGYVLNMLRSRDGVEPTMDPKEGVDVARNFLEQNGFEGLRESYYWNEAGIVVANFSCMENDVIIYPDLIKVGVSLDDGTIVRFEARGYLMNHRDRTLPSPAVSVEEAQGKLDQRLTVTNTALALIPTDGGEEALCYEFLCETDDGVKILVYCDTETGMEKRLLIMTENENGTLTK